jgi:hypothetical protein
MTSTICSMTALQLVAKSHPMIPVMPGMLRWQ